MITQAEPNPETWWVSKGYVTFRDGLTAASSYAPNEPLKPIYVPHMDHVGGFLQRLQNEGQIVSADIDPILAEALWLRHQLRQIADGEELVQVMTVWAVELANRVDHLRHEPMGSLRQQLSQRCLRDSIS